MFYEVSRFSDCSNSETDECFENARHVLFNPDTREIISYEEVCHYSKYGHLMYSSGMPKQLQNNVTLLGKIGSHEKYVTLRQEYQKARDAGIKCKKIA